MMNSKERVSRTGQNSGSPSAGGHMTCAGKGMNLEK
jgi:hypothetical protein